MWSSHASALSTLVLHSFVAGPGNFHDQCTVPTPSAQIAFYNLATYVLHISAEVDNPIVGAARLFQEHKLCSC